MYIYLQFKKKPLTMAEIMTYCQSLEQALKKINPRFTVDFEPTNLNQNNLFIEGTFYVRSVGLYWRNLIEVIRLRDIWIKTF